MPTDPIDEQLAAYNARDLERFLACYAPDVLVEDGSGTVLGQGIDAMRAAYSALFAGSPDLHADVLNRIRAGDFVIDEERVTGMPGSSEPVHAAVVYRLSDGQIAQVRMLR